MQLKFTSNKVELPLWGFLFAWTVSHERRDKKCTFLQDKIHFYRKVFLRPDEKMQNNENLWVWIVFTRGTRTSSSIDTYFNAPKAF